MASTPTAKTARNIDLDQMSRGIDKILARLSADQRPTKLTLLNDLAVGIRSGCNWGALRASQDVTLPKVSTSNAALIPRPPPPSISMVAQLTPIGGNHLAGFAGRPLQR